jgi:hypothetical protein
VTDNAGNSDVVTGTLDVKASRTNRNYFLFPGNNFMGLAIIPDDGDDSTTDDASMDRLMSQDVSNRVSSGIKSYLGSATVTLGDVVESTFVFNDHGNFEVHTPGPALDVLTTLRPFQGMNVNTRETVTDDNGVSFEVFKKVPVAGFTATQAVPIRINIEGVFFDVAQAPPAKRLRVGYNLVAPHIKEATEFNRVFGGALNPVHQAITAIAFDRTVDATFAAGDMSAQIVEGFVAKSGTDVLKPQLSYWTFIASNPSQEKVHPDTGDELGPEISLAGEAD